MTIQHIEIGKGYSVKHSRKGQFDLKITRFCEEWATGIIIEGKAGAMLPENEIYEGEEITVRRSFCIFSEIKAAQ